MAIAGVADSRFTYRSHVTTSTSSSLMRRKLSLHGISLGGLALLTFFPVFLGGASSGETVTLFYATVCLLSIFYAIPLIKLFGPYFIGISLMFSIALINSGSIFYALKEPIRLQIFFLDATVCALLAWHDCARLQSILRLAILFIAVTALTVILFRFATSIELYYYTSPLAKLFVDPSLLYRGAGDLAFNSSDADKAGGILFANGNQAAAFYVIAACTTQFLAFQKAAARWLTILFIVTVICTGSKTPIFFSLIGLGLLLLLRLVAYLKAGASTFFLMLLPSIIPAALLFTLLQLGNVLEQIDTFAVRIALWTRAAEYLPDYFFFGSEPNFWSDLWSTQGSLYWNYLPVHNYIFASLMFSGIAPLVFIVIQIGIILARFISISRINHRFIYASLGFLYLIAYSMLENLTPFGDPRASLLLAAMFAIATTELRPRMLWPRLR